MVLPTPAAPIRSGILQRHKPGRQKSHWHNSAESYCLVGDAVGKATIEILKAAVEQAR